MKQDNNGPLLDHNYDGIQEYDNPLPNWWLVTFFGAIIFAFVYWIHYEFGGGWTHAKELAHDLQMIESLAAKAPQSQESEEELKGILATLNIEAGKATYEAKCASCHGARGEGLIGPNLTDNHWIHYQGSLVGKLKVIREGVLDKGMPAWKDLMSKNEIMDTIAFLVSIKGTNPPNAKAPQGELVE